ncbi:hypothetical protein A5630_25430 [Mycolicibacterium mucogenicum]|uniref:Uncharacterized protein n=1 Tax=Mycolicibacterium mucogenicum TaxID=56689 RepID=A0A1A3GY48_MYCMU|nr:hypothetical protein [Mycolicibacterium mucogenicum]OBJ40296.1 hypothetical protein A5630_25430 [Mycolicibacterium mucogenicum]
MLHVAPLSHLLVEHNRWVYAATVKVLNATVAVVYRSGWLRDSSAKMAPILGFLGEREATVLGGFIEDTVELIHNSAKVSIYEVQDAAPAPGTPEFTSVEGALGWVRDWVRTGSMGIEVAA